MKRIISIILAITTIACFFSIGAFAAAAPGDVTGDGQINSEDALEILMVSVELKTATEEQMKVGDVDLSGDFTSSDALLVLLYSVDAEIKVQKISTDKKEFKGKPGDTFQISAAAVPTLAKDTGIVYSSTDEKTAIVDNNGNVTLKDFGTCEIVCASASDGSISQSVKVVSENPVVKVSSVKLGSNPENMSQGSRYQIKYTVSPSNATNQKMAWKSSDTTLAAVDENGVIKAKVIGKVTITGTTTDGSNISVKYTVNITDMNIPYVNQLPKYPTGCEAASSCMLLKYYGFSINIDQMVDIIPRKNLYYKNGKRYGPDINEMFVGDPKGSYTSNTPGYGAFSPCVTKALQTAIDQRGGKYTAKKISGCTFDELLGYVSDGYPVMVWATYKMKDPTEYNAWYIEGTGKYFKYPRGTHVMILSGYDKNQVVTVDPYNKTNNNNLILRFDKSLFKSRWELLDRQGIILVKK